MNKIFKSQKLQIYDENLGKEYSNEQRIASKFAELRLLKLSKYTNLYVQKPNSLCETTT